MAAIVKSSPHPSLASSIEKLLEAEYFLGALACSNGAELRYNLNAFLSACRSVTFVLQKSMATVDGFKPWYAARQAEMRADPAMGFFLELRNISQHEGPVSIVGGSTPEAPGWTYRFAGNREAVPTALIGKDVTRACADHLIKIAGLLASFQRTFPHESCLHAALTGEGLDRLGFTLDEAAALLGLPPGYLSVAPGIPLEEKLRLLRRELDPIDGATLQRLSAGRFLRGDKPLIIADGGGLDLTDDIAALMESGEHGGDPRVIFLTAIGRRIQEAEERR